MHKLHSLRPHKYRAIWVSDVHLGYRGCKAEYLLDFLHATESEYLFLVGDIIDLWSMKQNMYWPQSHNNILRTILGKAKRGTQVIYIPGNHDELLRDYVGSVFGNIELKQEHLHQTADGRNLLIMHGDEFDTVLKCNRLTKFLGDRGYDLLLALNRWMHHTRKFFGFPYWSLAGSIKCKVKNAMNHIRRFEEAVAQEAKKRQADGVVCGHIHHAEIQRFGDFVYCNDGDWVENCTSLVEHHDGTLELLHWTEKRHSVKKAPVVLAQEDAA